ncbi:hypothetical protein SPONN_347 [uncultured Candidatus Thioglobus sp.]|nr:hypothetical protein SPONN_347 [uncultured Candidatus Thioglobus sp.]
MLQCSYSSIQECIKAVLHDEGFHLPSDEATASLKSATSLCEWLQCSQNKATGEVFNHKITAALKDCIKVATHTGKKGVALNKQCLWSTYQGLISSSNFRAYWDQLFKEAKLCSNALVYQFATQRLMDYLIVKAFPIPQVSSSSSVPELTYIEENGLRYVCGYIVKTVKHKVSKSSSSMKVAFQFGLDSMISHDDKESDVGCSTDWVDLIDRGGLIHVSQDCYLFFFSVEMVVRMYFRDTTEEEYMDKGCGYILEVVCKDVDVLYYWDICLQELQEEEKAHLLPIVVKHYITVRGFSFARSLLEKYKRSSKKTTQKSKGLRKKISK